ncbi:MAG: hypothetical protein DMG70_04230 [Acidobacteria bacterium]|nr:MAG: hypothetical protein DMG70_04230 [Acidobacteriota bacterium]
MSELGSTRPRRTLGGFEWNKFDKAEPYYRRILALGEKQFGNSSVQLTSAIEKLASILTNLGRLDEARQLRKPNEQIMSLPTTR